MNQSHGCKVFHVNTILLLKIVNKSTTFFISYRQMKHVRDFFAQNILISIEILFSKDFVLRMSESKYFSSTNREFQILNSKSEAKTTVTPTATNSQNKSKSYTILTFALKAGAKRWNNLNRNERMRETFQ